MVAVIYINVITCPLFTRTQSCIMLAQQCYLDTNFMNIQIPDVWLLSHDLRWGFPV